MTPTTPTPPGQADVVATLRAAGCVFAEEEAALLVDAAATPEQLAALVRQRVDGLPLEHLLGWVEFCGLRIAVDRDVFVPRRRTEVLVEQAVARCAPGSVVVDLCCGSAAVGVAVASRVASVELHAVDIDPAAVRCARRNVHGVASAHVHLGDLFAPLPRRLQGRVSLVVANAPYVPTDAIALMPPEARDHEPAVALDGGADGLDVHRRIAAAAPAWLVAGGQLLMEASERQADTVVDVFARHGLVASTVTSDERGATVVIGTSPRR